MKYNVNYFIKKFKAIPEEKWCTEVYGNVDQHCALGHCGAEVGESTNESDALIELFRPLKHYVSSVNDGISTYTQKTPKLRILAALNDIKNQKR